MHSSDSTRVRLLDKKPEAALPIYLTKSRTDMIFLLSVMSVYPSSVIPDILYQSGTTIDYHAQSLFKRVQQHRVCSNLVLYSW